MDQKNSKQSNLNQNESFQKKIWVIAAIVSFVVFLLWMLTATFSVFLLVLAGTLVALFFTALSNKIKKITKWKETVCTVLSIITSLLVVIGLFWLIGAKVQSQFEELTEIIPEFIENAEGKLNDSAIGKTLIAKLTSESSIKKAQGFAGQFFQSTFGVFGDVYVILFIGIFFAISPKTYSNGILQLIPVNGQKKAKQVFYKLGEQLRNWLKGKLLSMLIVFILTAIGLAIIGVKLWLVLALLAGLISFIPNFGPLIALIPAVLVALMQSAQTALIVVGLYTVIQFIESNFITTIIQKKLINMPPALIIIAQLIMGTLTGSWGLILATPITVIIIVLVQELYLSKNKNLDTKS